MQDILSLHKSALFLVLLYGIIGTISGMYIQDRMNVPHYKGGVPMSQLAIADALEHMMNTVNKS